MTQKAPPQRIAAIVDDLLFASRIEGTLRVLGYIVQTMPVARASVVRLREWMPDGIVISFGAPMGDSEDVIRAIRAEPALRDTPLLAFGPHVDEAGREAARAAGATRVVTNGAFFNRMPAIAVELVGDRQ